MEHILMINERGDPVDPSGNVACQETSQPKLPTEPCGSHQFSWFETWQLEDMARSPNENKYDYETHLKRLFEHMIDKAPTKQSQDAEGPVRKVMIFVHGGLNSQVGTIKRAQELYDDILNEPQIPNNGEGYYPIFVNWDSSLVNSYLDHLIHIRQGEYWDLVKSIWLIPFYLATDIGRSIFRAPIVWTFQAINTVSGWSFVTTERQDFARNIQSDLCKEYYYPSDNSKSWCSADEHPPNKSVNDKADAIPIWYGLDYQKEYETERILSGISYVITLPTKILLAPFLDAFGKSAWDNMNRRTGLLFHTADEFETNRNRKSDANKRVDGTKFEKYDAPLPHVLAHGGLSVFMRCLQKVVLKNGGPERWDITLVGHSMGTIIVNQMVRDFADLPKEESPYCPGVGETENKAEMKKESEEISHSKYPVMPFNKIVYMAGATTIRDYQDTIFPYLIKNPATHLYHLTLHMKAEVRDKFELFPYFDPPPRGSLLVWIDDFLSTPKTPLDRTVGRYTNLLPAMHNTPEDLRSRIHIKAFNAGKQQNDNDAVYDPQKHGDFTEPFRFWNEECWEVTTKNENEDRKCARTK